MTMSKGYNEAHKQNVNTTLTEELDVNYLQDKQEESDRIELFKKDIAYVINKHSMEDESNTPDYVLANYLYNCLLAFNRGVNDRTEFYNVEFPIDDVFIEQSDN